MRYKVTISEEFCVQRDKKIAEDTRGDSARINWDFEYPENHITKIPGSMYQKWEGGEWRGKTITHHPFDAIHEFFGSCDFKYLSKKGKVKPENQLSTTYRY